MSAMSDLLRAMRLKKGMTQEELANEIGIAHNTYVRYETGMREPRAGIAARIAEYYGISVGELLSGRLKVAPDASAPREVSDADIRFALLGGDGTDEEYEQVKRFAAFLRTRRDGGAL